MMRAVLLLLVIAMLAGCSPGYVNTDPEKLEPATFPLDEYEMWDKYEALNDAQRAGVHAAGMGSVFEMIGPMNVSEWWVLLVEPGTYELLMVTLYMDAGVYVSDDVVFADNYGQTRFDRPPITVDAETFERYPFEDGMRVVAFVHFPDSPKGQLLKWEVTP